MPKLDDNFRELMRDVLGGSEEAATDLFRDCEHRILHVIRSKLHKRMRSKFDSLDFAQDVWASFFADLFAKRQFETSEDLLAYLTTLAQNKVTDAFRQRMTTDRHNLNREMSLDDSRQIEKDDLIGPEPSPSQLASSEEQWREFLRKQPPIYRRIFVLLREGKTPDAIGAELGINERTVRRIAQRLVSGGLP